MMLIGPEGNNLFEEFWTILNILMTVSFFAYIIGKVSEVLNDISASKKKYQGELEAIMRYIDVNKVSR